MPRRKPSKGKRTTAKKVQESESLPPPPFNLPPAPPATPEPDDDAWDDYGLTLKQRLFAEAYVGAAAGNATNAAEMAGYRDDNRTVLASTGCENLRKPNIQRAIARLIANKLGSPEWTRAGIVEIANNNLAEFLTYDDAGNPSLDLKKAAEGGALGTLREIKEEGIQTGNTVAIIKRTFKVYDRLKALEILAKMNGQLKDQHEHTIKPTPTHDFMTAMLADPAAHEALGVIADKINAASDRSTAAPAVSPSDN